MKSEWTVFHILIESYSGATSEYVYKHDCGFLALQNYCAKCKKHVPEYKAKQLKFINNLVGKQSDLLSPIIRFDSVKR